MGGKGEGIREHKLVVTEQSWGPDAQQREHGQSYCDKCTQGQMGATSWDDHLVSYSNVQPLGCAPET